MTLIERLRNMFFMQLPVQRRHKEIMQQSQCCKEEITEKQHKLAQRLHVLEWYAGLVDSPLQPPEHTCPPCPDEKEPH